MVTLVIDLMESMVLIKNEYECLILNHIKN